MAQQDIIREFLVSLGFKVDERGLKEFKGGVEDATKAVEILVGTIAGAAMAIVADVASFSKSIENVYFAAQRSNASVSGLKAIGNAAENFGVDAKEAAANVESLASSLRNNPGNEGFINSLGVKTRGANNELREMSEIMVDLGHQLSLRDQMLRKPLAEQVGVSERMMLAVTNPAFQASYLKMKGLQDGANFDLAAQKAHDFDNRVRDLTAVIEKFGVIFRGEMLDLLGPQMESVARSFERSQGKAVFLVRVWTQAIKDMYEVTYPLTNKLYRIADLLYRLGMWSGEKMFGPIPNGDFSPMSSHGVGAMANDLKMTHSGSGKSGGATSNSFIKFLSDKYEKMYGLPDGLIERSVQVESSGNKNAVSPKGAQGLGQLMPGTARDLGVTDPFDPEQSVRGMGKYYQELLIRYSGNLEKAVAAYNWGPGNVDKYGLGSMPAETRNHVEKIVGGLQYSQNTTINVNGSGDPAAVGRSVADEQQRVGADAIRNMQSKVQ